MKKIVLELPPQKVILVDQLNGNEIVAYRCPDSSSVCLLTQIVKSGQKSWGFINLSHPQSQPTFCAVNFYEAIKLVVKNRNVCVFQNQDDLISSIYNKSL